jgi:hypothetical protein
MEMNEEQTSEEVLETLCILDLDLEMMAGCGLQRTMLYREVNDGPTATMAANTEMVKIES